MIDLRYFLRDNTINRKLRNSVKNEQVSFISSDCLGGVLYKALHRRMDSPTINMFFSASDFIKFCENMDYYLEQEVVNDEKNRENGPWPIGKLGDIRLQLVHYKSVEEAAGKWEERKKRIHRDALYFIMNDRNGCTEREIAAFDALPYEHKVIFTHKPYPQYKCVYCVPGCEQDGFVKIMTSYAGLFTLRRRYDDFDFAAWIDRGIIQQRRKGSG